jgi:hypothetical protein
MNSSSQASPTAIQQVSKTDLMFSSSASIYLVGLEVDVARDMVGWKRVRV